MRIAWKKFQYSEDLDENLNCWIFFFTFKEENGRFYKTFGKQKKKKILSKYL